jgi:hypothetical protein
MTNGPAPRYFGRAVDGLDYCLTLVRLLTLDVLAGPEPETPGDQQRRTAWERMEQAFPELYREEAGTVSRPSLRSRSCRSFDRPAHAGASAKVAPPWRPIYPAL